MIILRQVLIFLFLTAVIIQSEHVQQALTLSNRKFNQLFGVKQQTFHNMLEILQEAFDKQHQYGGKPTTKVHVEDRLLITLQYWREYRTMEHLAYEYDTVVSNIHKAIVWVENTLIQDGTYRLPGKKALIAATPASQDSSPRVMAIDVTEHPIERPKKSRRNTIPARRSVIL